MKGSLEDRFWAKVDKHGPTKRFLLGECWPWTGYINSAGYGRFKTNGRMVTAPRVSWELANGPIPQGKQINHLCGFAACVRPTHLYCGTQFENRFDAIRDGTTAKGEQNGKAKLRAEDVIAIRCLKKQGVPHRVIARRFGIDPTYVRLLARHVNWKHISQG